MELVSDPYRCSVRILGLDPGSRFCGYGVIEARVNLDGAYDMLEKQLAGKTWAAGQEFSMADCSAAPALFYSECIHPFTPTYPFMSAYFDRLMSRPSVRRVLDEARPYFQYFPFQDAIPARFL